MVLLLVLEVIYMLLRIVVISNISLPLRIFRGRSGCWTKLRAHIDRTVMFGCLDEDLL